ncbi:MAG: hypothetical protein BWY02_01267 [bacterium ADurb.Bin157]|jgi:PLP dependent protein|nr:YggS family pyridoxal phosphate-dependent enzyme [Candidatus Riflebacteria bacterium]NLV95206.1 YggS family pyridoxal phosphate-dependent enzyme [Candidatus Riflebacteria bacterium]OQB49678.1 MAG: hypothetical protein BWY02_01267 [bacterium ADurb.Bin157]
MYLLNNLNRIKSEIADALKASGRAEQKVELIAVSKTVNSEEIRKLYSYGQRSFAENRPQALRDKTKELSDLNIEWHFIGHLQSNKIKYVYPTSALVHSVDRIELIEEFKKYADKTGVICPFLLQVHISGESTKQGFDPSEILDIIKQYNNDNRLSIKGLMGMAPLNSDTQTTGDCFKRLYTLFNESRQSEGSSYKAEVLSMGMSGDFVLAISEGSTMVRIGSALFNRE